MPYHVVRWEQRHNDAYVADYAGQPTDLFAGGVQLNYDQLVANAASLWRATNRPFAYDYVPAPPVVVVQFQQANYEEIVDGTHHCTPTSAAMAHNYWWINTRQELPTIRRFQTLMHTNELGGGPEPGNHRLYYGTYLSDGTAGIAQESPGAPWPGNYHSANHPVANDQQGPTPAERSLYFGEIRAGRPTMVNVAGHSTMGINFNPATGAIVNDPWDGTVQTKTWQRDPANADPQHWVTGFLTQQPERLPDLPAGSRAVFSNDNFGTGQGNAQAPGGDPGDVFGSDLDMSYGRQWNDALRHGGADYEAGAVTNGREYPWDIDALDVLRTIQPMTVLTYSLDHGDPNPHDWIPGNPMGANGAVGNPSYQQVVGHAGPVSEAFELLTVRKPTDWYTSGTVWGALQPVTATEEALGLNRGEWSLPGSPLDDDLDAVDLEWGDAWSFSVDYVDLRVFPDASLLGAGTAWQVGGKDLYWELSGWDPTDIYFSNGAILDGETMLGLSNGTDLDAMQFISRTRAGTIDGLLFSVDGDAPECTDRFGNALDPGTIYLSWLDGARPEAFFYVAPTDVDAITWAVPEPVTTAGLLLGLGVLVRYVRKRR